MSQGLSSELFQSYRIGWRDSARTWIKDKRFAEHERADIRAAYDLGWGAQLEARKAALEGYAATVGYDFSLAIIDR